MMKNIKMR